MNWDAIGALGEIGGSIAVVLTLVVLIRQVRAAASATRAATLESMGDRIQSRLLLNVTDETLAALLMKSRSVDSLSDFDELDSHKLKYWWFINFNHEQIGFMQRGVNAATDADLLYRRETLINRLKNPVAMECWQLAKQGEFALRKDFVEFVEEQWSSDA